MFGLTFLFIFQESRGVCRHSQWIIDAGPAFLRRGQATTFAEQAGASRARRRLNSWSELCVNFSRGRVLERGHPCLQCSSSKKTSFSGNNSLKFSITATDSMPLRKLEVESKL